MSSTSLVVGRRGRYPLWTAAAIFFVLLVIAPYLPIVASLMRGGGESWTHVRDTVLTRYVINTAVLVGASVFLATVIGITGAWILERYKLPGERLVEVLFLAPLALPVYVATFTWNGILSYGGSLYRLAGATVPFRGWPAAVFVLSLGLYPYVYLTVRAALMANSRGLFEVVASLSGGGSRRGYWRRLWSGVMPSLRPAVVGGASLVAMEVMNAYATPVYLGVETLSTGVFRTWFGLGDLSTATTLAGLVFFAMIGLLAVEEYGRGRRRYTAGTGAPPRPVPVGSFRRWLLAVVVVIPPLLGFVIPAAQLVWWTGYSLPGIGVSGLAATVGRTVLLAGAATVGIVLISLVLNMAAYLRPNRGMRWLLRVAGIGYAVPGTVVAVGVLAVFRALSVIDDRLFLFGTVAGLVFAYAARYMAVALQPIQAGFARQHRSAVDAARSLGSGPAAVLTRVVMPVFRPTLLGAALLVAIDVIKDLPMTLLLRPFDFNTLAVQVYRLAMDERMPEAAPRSLLLVVVGIFTIGLMMRPKERA